MHRLLRSGRAIGLAAMVFLAANVPILPPHLLGAALYLVIGAWAVRQLRCWLYGRVLAWGGGHDRG